MPRHWAGYAQRSLALLLLAVSPVGAPAIGYLILSACDLPWEGQVQCAVPTALVHYFVLFTILPFVWVGTFLASLWFMMSIAVILACLGYAGCAIWHAVMERP